MSNADADPSPKRIREARAALAAFRASYVEYLNATVGASRHPSAEQELRASVARRLPGAQRAMVLVGTDVGWDLRHAGGQLIRGLANVAFLHETPHGYSTSIFTPGITPYQGVLDVLEATAGYLDEAEAEARRRRRNPLYWLDRVLRAVLGLPAYVVSLVFRVPLERVEASPLALPLRLFGIGVEIAGIFAAGRLAGWW